MISAEGPPLQHAGALIDVMDALPRELRAGGHDVSVALPFYREIRENTAFNEEDSGVTVDVRVGEKTYVAEYLEGLGVDAAAVAEESTKSNAAQELDPTLRRKSWKRLDVSSGS